MTPPSRRHAQQIAAATLANLLSQPVPEAREWVIRNGTVLHGELETTDRDVIRLHLHQWAAILTTPVWQLIPDPTDVARLELTGTWGGVAVRVWGTMRFDFDADSDAFLAELSAPPAVDLTGEGPAEPDDEIAEPSA